MKNMSNIYTDGSYLESTSSWHAEDSLWKAQQVAKIIENNRVEFSTVAEVGCGAGEILLELSQLMNKAEISYTGYDISPQAIELAKKIETDQVKYRVENILDNKNDDVYDLLLMLDVFEHVPDYMGFLESCRSKAKYKIFHIPLDLHVSSVLRNGFIKKRYTIGHIHYFSAESALATLKDTGYEIKDYFYTNAAIDLFSTHPSFKKAIANVPRWVISRFSTPLSSRLLGGYSLLVLAE